jgi:hypothetical protein
MKVPGLHTIRTMPGQIADGVSALTGAAGHVTTAVTRVPSDVLALLGRAEDLVTRIEILLPALEQQLDRVDVVTIRAERMLAFAEPLVESGEPLARAFTAHAKPEHVVSIMTMLDLLPEISVRIVPAVQSLVELTPELDLLIERFDNVAKIVQGIPGARLFQRRTETSEQTDPE